MPAIGLSILILFAGAIFACTLYLLLRPIVRGAVYFPTPPKRVATMLRLGRIGPGMRVADLGSGDGRVLVACAQAGAEAHGYEINPLLVRRSRKAIVKQGCAGKAFVHWESFWRKDFSEFDAVIVYGIPYIMHALGKKLEKELKPGARIVSHVFQFPDMPCERSEERVFLYTQHS